MEAHGAVGGDVGGPEELAVAGVVVGAEAGGGVAAAALAGDGVARIAFDAEGGGECEGGGDAEEGWEKTERGCLKEHCGCRL